MTCRMITYLGTAVLLLLLLACDRQPAGENITGPRAAEPRLPLIRIGSNIDDVRRVYGEAEQEGPQGHLERFDGVSGPVYIVRWTLVYRSGNLVFWFDKHHPRELVHIDGEL